MISQKAFKSRNSNVVVGKESERRKEFTQEEKAEISSERAILEDHLNSLILSLENDFQDIISTIKQLSDLDLAIKLNREISGSIELGILPRYLVKRYISSLYIILPVLLSLSAISYSQISQPYGKNIAHIFLLVGISVILLIFFLHSTLKYPDSKYIQFVVKYTYYLYEIGKRYFRKYSKLILFISAMFYGGVGLAFFSFYFGTEISAFIFGLIMVVAFLILIYRKKNVKRQYIAESLIHTLLLFGGIFNFLGVIFLIDSFYYPKKIVLYTFSLYGLIPAFFLLICLCQIIRKDMDIPKIARTY